MSCYDESIIVTYRTDFSFIILRLPLVMIWLLGPGPWWRNDTVSTGSPSWSVFQTLDPSLVLVVCRAIISGLSLDFQILQTELGTRGQTSQVQPGPARSNTGIKHCDHSLEPVLSPVVVVVCVYSVGTQVSCRAGLYGSAWSCRHFMKLPSPPWCLAVFSTTTPQSDL